MSSYHTLKGVFSEQSNENCHKNETKTAIFRLEPNCKRNFVMENIRSVNKSKKYSNTQSLVAPNRTCGRSGDNGKLVQKHKASQTAISSALLNNDESLLLDLLRKCSIDKCVQTEELGCEKKISKLNKEVQNNLYLEASQQTENFIDNNVDVEHNFRHNLSHCSQRKNDEIYGKQIETTRSEENFEKQTSQEEYRPGWYYVPENEKELRLEKLQTEFHNCLEEMNRLPFYSTTLRVRNRKIELERKLGKIEDEIRFFSRSKVFIKIEILPSVKKRSYPLILVKKKKINGMFMHPRNIYKIPPSFKELADQFPDFAQYVQKDSHNKHYINFQNIEAIRALNVTLLKKDFNINLEIPLNHLIPTIPLRLNYILWLEDLLSICHPKESAIHGIDVGTGASCVYPLLAARKNNWNMTATEISEESMVIARNNIQLNPDLKSFITLKFNKTNAIFLDIIDNDCIYDFSMCNPPFFRNENDFSFELKSRSVNRRPPRNAFAATSHEIFTIGGEVDFVNNMIEESQEIGPKIRIYTTMLGQKKSLIFLKQRLKQIQQVISYQETEFYQGNTVRWGLAWTYCDIDLRNVPEYFRARKDKTRKYSFEIPETANFTITDLMEKIRTIFNELQISHDLISKKSKCIKLKAIAKEDTWSHQRRKRRQQKQSNSNLSSLDNMLKNRLPLKRSFDNENEFGFYRNDKRMKIDPEFDLVEFILTIWQTVDDFCIDLVPKLIDESPDKCGHKKQMLHGITLYLRNHFQKPYLPEIVN